MKKVLFTLLAVAGLSLGNAQNSNPTNVENIDYIPSIGKERITLDQLPDVIEITIVKRFLSDKVNVQLDAGQDTSFFSFAPRKTRYITKGNEVDIDKTLFRRSRNNRIEFNSTTAVLAYFKALGYEVSLVNGYAGQGAPSSGILQLFGLGKTKSRGQRIILTKV